MNRTSERILVAAAAIALQAAFIAVLLKSAPISVFPTAAHEITIVLPLIREQPQSVQLPAPAKPDILATLTIPRLPAIPPVGVPGAAVGTETALPGLAVALFRCGPEEFGNLPEEERALCPRYTTHATIAEFPDLLGERSQVENNERWANALAHEQSPLILPCLGGLDVICLLRNVADVADGSAFDSQSYLRDPEQWQTYVDAEQFMPRDLNDQERDYDAWNRTHGSQPR
ncbi:MAG TPA: hypothetical protein VKR31_09525 [Rhizomicrobium sp.]|nr:hypothetical protein [Rhizomicrobium sp.]